MKKHKTEIKWQIIVAVIYTTLGLIQAYFNDPQVKLSLAEIIGVLNVTISQFVCMNLIANWLFFKHPYLQSPLIFFSYLILIFTCYFIFKYLTIYPDYTDILKTYPTNTNVSPLIFFTFIQLTNFVITYIISLGLYSIKKSFAMERKAKRLELEISKAKLSNLRNQINPHFLYNTLSYMYAQARPVSENLSKSILLLSEMMRYSLDNTQNNTEVPLELEIDYIQNYVEIHSLRFEKDFYVNFEIEGIIKNEKILPMVLINYVENAIKHGITNDIKNPINISLKVSEENIIFETTNKKQKGHKDFSSGIGLANTQNRLRLYYKQDFNLEVEDENKIFKVNLIIKKSHKK